MLTSPINNAYVFPRRVSFDLSHNKVHVLPTLEECRDAAKKRSREEWNRKSLNEDMLSDDIIIEIQEDCSASSRHTDSEEEDNIKEFEPKSCLKKPPVVVVTTPAASASSVPNTRKRTNSKKNQKKRKRTNSQGKNNSHTHTHANI